LALKEKRLKEIELKWSKKSTVCVILTSVGYPGDYPKGKLIKGLDKVATQKDVAVFHSGTTLKRVISIPMAAGVGYYSLG